MMEQNALAGPGGEAPPPDEDQIRLGVGNAMGGGPVPQGGPPPQGAGNSLAGPPPLNPGQSMAQYEAVKKSAGMLDAIRGSLDQLTKLADMVKPEDVVKEAQKIVAAGVSPTVVASLLAQMPTDSSEALQAWISEQDQQISQKEAVVDAKMSQMQFQLGSDALKMLALGHLQQTGEAPGGAPGEAQPVPEGAPPPAVPSPMPSAGMGVPPKPNSLGGV